MVLYGWIEVAASNNCAFQNTVPDDIILRTTKADNKIVIGNSSSNTCNAAIYISGNNVGIKKQPNTGVSLDVDGITVLQSCQIGNQNQAQNGLTVYGNITVRNTTTSNDVNISTSNDEIRFTYNTGSPRLKITNGNGMTIDDTLSISKEVFAQGFNMMSDSRLKTDITSSDVSHDYEVINKLNVVDFKWLADTTSFAAVHKGFIAQNVEGAIPAAVKYNGDTRTIDVSQIVALNTSVLQSLIKRIDVLEKYMTGYIKCTTGP